MASQRFVASVAVVLNFLPGRVRNDSKILRVPPPKVSDSAQRNPRELCLHHWAAVFQSGRYYHLYQRTSTVSVSTRVLLEYWYWYTCTELDSRGYGSLVQCLTPFFFLFLVPMQSFVGSNVPVPLVGPQLRLGDLGIRGFLRFAGQATGAETSI